MKFLKVVNTGLFILFCAYLGILISSQRYYNYRDTIHHDTIVVLDGNEKVKVLRRDANIVDKVDKVVENPTFKMAQDNAITVALCSIVLLLFLKAKKND